MGTIVEARLSELQAKYPKWEIWHTSQVYGPGWWNAKPKGAQVATVNKQSADDLDEWLAGQP